MKIYRNEKAPTMKDGCIWIHRSKYKDTSSPLIAEVWSGNGWEELQSEEITEDIKEILGDINVLSSELVGHGQAIDALELKIDDLVEITYSDLKALRDAGNLVPGRQYRITDYDCTTVQEDTQSAGHPFDIIVVADDEKTLNENARAIQSERDTEGYFADSKLEAWELKYSLDNNRNRFGWADPVNGKGVIYYMKDEFGNECPYDFKNIQYKRYKIVASEKCPGLVGQYGILDISDYSVDTEDFIYAFTFTWVNGDNEIEDVSVMWTELSDDEGNTRLVNNNIILSYHETDGDTRQEIQHLNNNVIISTHEYEEGLFYGINRNTFGNACYRNTFGNDCDSNTFGDKCSSNTFGNYCYSNTFGNSCNSNTFGNDCDSNTFGNYCNSNTFGNYCYSNTFGNSCYSNTFGNYCYSNTFGNSCYSNTFGNYCYSNTFGNNCSNNTFGNDCHDNTFGNNCSDNTFGNYCYDNTFGNDYYGNTFGNNCQDNTFGNDCSDNTFGNDCYGNTFGYNCLDNTFGNDCSLNTFGNYCYGNTFGASKNSPKHYYRYNYLSGGVQYCNVDNTETSSYGNQVQFYEVGGMQGTYSNPVQISVTRNNQYTTTVQKNSSGEIKQFCLADLVQ